MTALSEDQLDKLIAEQGICDLNLPDTCNTDPDVEKTLSMVKTSPKGPGNVSAVDPALSINTSHVFAANQNIIITGDYSDNKFQETPPPELHKPLMLLPSHVIRADSSLESNYQSTTISIPSVQG